MTLGVGDLICHKASPDLYRVVETYDADSPIVTVELVSFSQFEPVGATRIAWVDDYHRISDGSKTVHTVDPS